MIDPPRSLEEQEVKTQINEKKDWKTWLKTKLRDKLEDIFATIIIFAILIFLIILPLVFNFSDAKWYAKIMMILGSYFGAVFLIVFSTTFSDLAQIKRSIFHFSPLWLVFLLGIIAYFNFELWGYKSALIGLIFTWAFFIVFYSSAKMLFNTGAIAESLARNADDALGEGDANERGTALKGALADRYDAVVKRYVGYLRAEGERRGADRRHYVAVGGNARDGDPCVRAGADARHGAASVAVRGERQALARLRLVAVDAKAVLVGMHQPLLGLAYARKLRVAGVAVAHRVVASCRKAGSGYSVFHDGVRRNVRVHGLPTVRFFVGCALAVFRFASRAAVILADLVSRAALRARGRTAVVAAFAVFVAGCKHKSEREDQQKR